MTTSDTIKKIITDVCFVKCEITPEMVLGDPPINCDSLDCAEIAMMLEVELSIKLDARMSECKTVGDVITYVEAVTA